MRWLCFAIVLLAAPVCAQSVPVIPYESVPNAVRLPPNMYLGEVAGVAVNSKKHVFVYSRGNTTGPAFGASAQEQMESCSLRRSSDCPTWCWQEKTSSAPPISKARVSG